MGKGYMRRRNKVVMKPHHGACFKEGCQENGGTIHTCLTCEKLAGAGGEAVLGTPIFIVQCCTTHYDEGLKRIKRHALTAHPVNLLRVMAAGLKGEKI
jgi:hypothetical protein